MNTIEFIAKANKVHNNKYTYENTIYVKSKEKVIITCLTHGNFEQVAYSHLKGHGCKKCGSSLSNLGIDKHISAYQFKVNSICFKSVLGFFVIAMLLFYSLKLPLCSLTIPGCSLGMLLYSLEFLLCSLGMLLCSLWLPAYPFGMFLYSLKLLVYSLKCFTLGLLTLA